MGSTAQWRAVARTLFAGLVLVGVIACLASSAHSQTTSTATTIVGRSRGAGSGQATDGSKRGFAGDLAIAIIGGVISALIAVWVARHGDREAEKRWAEDRHQLDEDRLEDRRFDRNRRRAEWIRDATTESLRAAQAWKAALMQASRSTSDDRSHLASLRADDIKLMKQIGALSTQIDEAAAREAADAHANPGHSASELQLVRRLNDERKNVLARVDDVGAQIRQLDDRIRAVVAEATNETHTQWMQAKGLVEVLAPELRGTFGDLETRLQRMQATLEPDGGDAVRAPREVDEAFAAMLGDARRQVERLLADELAAQMKSGGPESTGTPAPRS